MATATADPAVLPEWASAHLLTKRIGISKYAVQRGVVLGKVRVRVEPGVTPLYNANDVLIYFAEHRASKLAR